MLKIIYSRIIPFPGFYAITLFGLMIIRYEYKNYPVPKSTLNHELIHEHQAYDFGKWIGYIPFYIWYLLEWLLKLIPCLITKNDAYKSISFEQEAYKNEGNPIYRDSRKKFNWLKYVFKLSK